MRMAEPSLFSRSPSPVISTYPASSKIRLASSVFCWFVGTLGLVMNLLAPRFDWQSENQPCKQSLSVCVTMFGAYFFAAVIVGVFFAVSALHIPGIAAYAVTTAFLLLLSALMHLLLVCWGAKKFERLEA